MTNDAAVNEEIDDVELVLRMMEHDEEALSIVIRRYSGKTIGGLRNKFGTTACEETLNDAIDHAALMVWTKAGEFDDSQGTLGGFFYTCALNKVYDTLRAGRKPESIEIVSLEALGRDITAQEDAQEEPLTPEREKLYKDLHESIQGLPDMQRRIIETDLMAGCNADNDYLADSLRTTKNSIFVSRSKAREKIRQEMRKRGHFK
ncbi:MAG: hypothetical protein L3K26_00055 [Candidatus Hydrogenedentes bacterium]|nr:hypothetical protein [Candidatus Hydrogenedentota bacterium]